MKGPNRPDDDEITDGSMKGPLIKSAVFHITIFLLTTISLPFIAKDSLSISTPISVEIVEVAKERQTNKIQAPKPEPKEEEKPEPKPQPKPEPEPKPEPPKPEPKKEPEPVKKPAEKPPPLPKPEPEKKKEVEKPKPEPEKKPEPEPEPKEEKKDFETLLKDLTPAEDTSSQTQPDVKDPPKNDLSSVLDDAMQTATLSDRLTMSEIDALRQGLRPCWNIQSGGKFAESQVVEVRVTMHPDRTVQSATIVDQGRYNRDSHFRAAADAALRALRNPQCSPLRLPTGKYNEWKDIIIEFNPSDML